MAPEIIYILAGKAYMEAIWIVPPVAMSLLLLLYTQFSTNIEFLYKKKKLKLNKLVHKLIKYDKRFFYSSFIPPTSITTKTFPFE